MLQIAVALENLVEIIRRFGHAMFELMHFVFDLLQVTERRQRRLVDSGTWFEMNMLREQAESNALGFDDVAAIRLLFVIDETEDGRLP
jgi:hypothetical protein